MWSFVNIIATGGWSNGYSYPATEDTSHENDPVWELYLMVYDNELVFYYWRSRPTGPSRCARR